VVDEIKEDYGLSVSFEFEDLKEMRKQELCEMARNIAKARDSHLISTAGLQALLSASGANCPVKAYVVEEFVRDVDKEMAELIKKYELEGGGVIVDVNQLLTYLIEKIYPSLKKKQRLHIKLSGDGRKSSRSFPFLLLTITILEDSEGN